MSSQSDLLSRVALGMATVMREPNKRSRHAVLVAAYEAGVRSVDVAPIYGLGAAEAEVGWLIARGATDVKVTTKFGRRLQNRGGLVRRLQTPARALVRRVPALRAVAQRAAKADGFVETQWSVASLKDELDSSLDRLGTQSVHRYLSHEVGWNPALTEPWLEFYEHAARATQVHEVGFSGPTDLISAYPRVVRNTADVLQVPFLDAEPTSEASVVRYSIVSELAYRIAERSQSSAELAVRWKAPNIAGATRGGVLALAVAAYLRWAPDHTVVIGTSSATHATELFTGVERWESASETDWELVAMDLGFGAGAR